MVSSPESALSPLYQACRNNDTQTVEDILSDMSVEKLNQLEPNGSTSLHAAAYYGHLEIVCLLLDKGAVSTIKNKFGLTAAEEARTDEIRKLFEKRVTHVDEDRFIGHANSIEWLTVNERAAEYAAFYQASLKKAYGDGLNRELLLLYLLQIYQKKPIGMHQVIFLVDLFFKNKDDNLIVTAYTVESDFYRTLNADLAKMIKHQNRFRTEVELECEAPGALAAFISYSPTLLKLSFEGETFRGMLITKSDLNQYKAGSIIMVKSFLSTSKDRSVSEWFANQKQPQKGASSESIRFPAICHYKIRYPNSSLAIENISIHKKEQEVLILPLTVFKVNSVTDKNSHFEIDLVQQRPLRVADHPNDVGGFCCVMCYYAWPSCYRMCCLQSHGAVEYPDP